MNAIANVLTAKPVQIVTGILEENRNRVDEQLAQSIRIAFGEHSSRSFVGAENERRLANPRCGPAPIPIVQPSILNHRPNHPRIHFQHASGHESKR